MLSKGLLALCLAALLTLDLCQGDSCSDPKDCKGEKKITKKPSMCGDVQCTEGTETCEVFLPDTKDVSVCINISES